MKEVGYDVTQVSSDQKMMDDLQQKADQSYPESSADARKRILRSIVLRRGQKKFRNYLLKAYDGRCAVTQCNAEDALEACHIYPYRDEGTNHVTNGLLLRADLHTLFDLQLLAIDLEKKTALLSPDLKGKGYDFLDGADVMLPSNEAWWPNKEALEMHRKEAQKDWG